MNDRIETMRPPRDRAAFRRYRGSTPQHPAIYHAHMIKLYRRENGRIVAYHEAWLDGRKVIEHWGRIGERGSVTEHRCKWRLSGDANVERVLSKAREQGFSPIEDDEHRTLLVEYQIDGWGTDRDLQKRHRLEERLNETLGWTGLGYCDGGSIGSGTMEACCFVVDFDVAKRVIQEDLADTEFADHHRIYCEEAEQ